MLAEWNRLIPATGTLAGRASWDPEVRVQVSVCGICSCSELLETWMGLIEFAMTWKHFDLFKSVGSDCLFVEEMDSRRTEWNTWICSRNTRVLIIGALKDWIGLESVDLQWQVLLFWRRDCWYTHSFLLSHFSCGSRIGDTEITLTCSFLWQFFLIWLKT